MPENQRDARKRKNRAAVVYNRIRTGVLPKYHLLKSAVLYRPLFEEMGRNSFLIKPLKLSDPQNISIGNNVSIFHKTWLLTYQASEKVPELRIDDGATIGHFNHITCVNRVYIGKNVLTADKVYISDNLHGYEDVRTPICFQPVFSKGEVSIGEDTWIGENVAVIGVKIGKHCVIGSNSVVTKDIPDFSVAAGAPAKVIKRYNEATGKWERV
jgi:acetyltransferase-like isoleucine patch superfamily enzyme